ncbi:MAG: phosphodiester glycosidase family protein [Methanoregulaceae archaeon]|nr:phosphodiester glycosidase family protein [Methanoregulaceae archaeon]
MLIALLTLSMSADVRHQRITLTTAGVDVVTVPMSTGKYRIDVILPSGFPSSDEDFGSMVKRPGLVAAINGAYFDRNSKKPIGDIWSGGTLRHFGAMGTALCVSSDGTVDIRRVQRHKRVDWSAYETVLACGPALVLDGELDCDPASEGFRDPAVMGRVPRMGVGYNASGDLMLVRCAKAVTFQESAFVMLQLGCREAMNLDSGASSALWMKGKTIVPAGRRLTNVIGVFAKG